MVAVVRSGDIGVSFVFVRWGVGGGGAPCSDGSAAHVCDEESSKDACCRLTKDSLQIRSTAFPLFQLVDFSNNRTISAANLEMEIDFHHST